MVQAHRSWVRVGNRYRITNAAPSTGTMIRDRLTGTRIAVTGSTGFLGTALVERLLRSVRGCELVLLVRPGRRSTPAVRARREIFGNDAFARLRSELGDDFDAEIARR